LIGKRGSNPSTINKPGKSPPTASLTLPFMILFFFIFPLFVSSPGFHPSTKVSRPYYRGIIEVSLSPSIFWFFCENFLSSQGLFALNFTPASVNDPVSISLPYFSLIFL
jgi:hypothetical protein